MEFISFILSMSGNKKRGGWVAWARVWGVRGRMFSSCTLLGGGRMVIERKFKGGKMAKMGGGEKGG